MDLPSGVQTMVRHSGASPRLDAVSNTMSGAARWNIVMPSNAYTAIFIVLA